MIKGTAYWAIGQIQGSEAAPYINERYPVEQDAEVKEEMLKGIQEISR